MGLLDGLDLSQFQVPEDERKKQQMLALIMTGLQFAGARKGQELQALAPAMATGLGTYYGGMNDARQAKRGQLVDANAAMELKSRAQALQDDAEYRKAMSGQYAAPAAMVPPVDQAPQAMGPPASLANPGAVMPAVGPRLSMDKGSDYERAIAQAQYLESHGVAPKYVEAAWAKAEKFRPKLKDTKTMTDGTGKRVQVQVYEDGTTKVLPDLGPDQEKAHFIDTGASVGAVDPFTGLPIKGGGLYNKMPTPGELLTDKRAQQNIALKAQELQGGDQPMSAEAIKNAAARYNIDGTLPPMGMGKVAGTYRSAILNEAANQAKGIDPEQQRRQQLENRGGAAALTQLQRSEAMVGAFEKNFNRNADIALEFSKKVDNTGVPIVNKWINAGKRAVTGDPTLSAYDASIKTAVNEYAKILSGSMGSQAMAESEVKKVEGLLNAAQTPQQVEEVVKLMKRETQNRMTGFKEQKKELIDNMRGGPKPGAVLRFDAQGNPI